MTAPAGSKVWTWQEALELPDGEKYEVINGELKERKMSYWSSIVAQFVARFLWRWIDDGHPGWVSGEAGGLTIFGWMPGDVRMPDLAYTSLARLPDPPVEGWSDVPPEFAVEVVSPNDHISDAEDKAADYIRAGVDLVWVVVPSTKSVHVWRKDGSRSVLRSGDVLSGESVLDGFTMPVAGIFDAFAK